MPNTYISLKRVLTRIGRAVLPAFAALALMTAGSAVSSADQASFRIDTSSQLRADGVSVRSAMNPVDMRGERPEIVVYLRFSQPFSQRVQLIAYNAQGQEIARSHERMVNGQTGDGQSVAFSFPESTRISNIHSVAVTEVDGHRGLIRNTPVRHEESFGEAAENIIEELFE